MDNISLKSIKWESVRSIFQAIASAQKISRAEVSAQTSLSLMTVGKVADALLDLHIVEQSRETKATAGRRAGLLSLSPDHYAVILDLTSRNFLMTVLNMRLETVERFPWFYRDDYFFEENLTQFFREVRRFLEMRYRVECCIGCGVSVPGSYSPLSDRTKSIHLPELSDVPVAAIVRQTLSPVRLTIESACNAAAFSNIADIPHSRDKSILYCFVDEGNVGGAVVHRGEILRGARNMAGSIGRMVVSRGRTLESAVRADNTPPENAALLARALYNMIMVLDPDAILLECELYRQSGGCTDEAFVQLLTDALTESCGLHCESLPEFISGGCQCRHSHRGLAMKLRELWLSSLVFGEEPPSSSQSIEKEITV